MSTSSHSSIKALLGSAALLGIFTYSLTHTTIVGTVVTVLDCDTFKIAVYKKLVTVRLARIDCPEKLQEFGPQAREYTEVVTYQKSVTVKVKGIDRYRRVLGEVTLENGLNLNETLVQGGYAWWYRDFAPHDTALANLEAEAKKAKRGLWGLSNPRAPWEWRVNH